MNAMHVFLCHSNHIGLAPLGGHVLNRLSGGFFLKTYTKNLSGKGSFEIREGMSYRQLQD